MPRISAHPWLVARRTETSRNWSNLFSPKSGDSRRQAENKQDSVGRPQSALHCCRLNVAELPLCVMAVSLIEIAGRVDTRCNTVIWMAHSWVLLLASFFKWCERCQRRCQAQGGEIGSQRSHFNQFRSKTAFLMLFPSRIAFHWFLQEVSLTCTAQNVPRQALNWDELQRYLKLPQASAIKFQVVEAFKLVSKCESFTFYVPLQLVSQFQWFLIANE